MYVRGIACIAAALLFPAAGHAQTTTIEVYYASPSVFNPTMHQIKDEFERAHPNVTIKYPPPAASYDEAIPQVLRGSIAGQIPDVMLAGANHVRLLADRGLAVPLDSFVNGASAWSALGFPDSIMSLTRTDGKTYGVPFSISMQVLHVNKTLLDKAGIKYAKFPDNWEELADYGQQVSAVTGIPGGFAFQYDAWGNWMLEALIKSKGGQMGSESSCKVGFDSAAGAWALETLEMFRRKGMTGLSQNQARQAFLAGQIAVLAFSSSFVGQATRETSGKFEYRTFPWPIPDAKGRLPAGGSVAVLLAKDPARQRAAWQFIEFIAGPAGQEIMVRNTGYLPSNLKAASSLEAHFDKNPNLKTSVAQLKHLSDWHTWPGPNGIKIITAIQDQVDGVVLGRTSAREAMSSMVREVQKLLPPCA